VTPLVILCSTQAVRTVCSVSG